MTQTVTALYDTYDAVVSAVNALEASGVPHSDISIVSNNVDNRYNKDRPTNAAEDAAFDKCFKEKGMLMCLCSRVASGRVVRSPGLQRRGFVAGDNLQPWKARLLLALALTITTNADEIQSMFDTY